MFSEHIVLIVVILCFTNCIFCISSRNSSIYGSRNLNSFAIQRKQFYEHQPQFHPGFIPQGYYGYDRYTMHAKPHSYNHMIHSPNIRPNPSLYYSNPHYQQSTEQSFGYNIINVLNSITKNDDLQCVPKIVCQLTSGGISSSRQLGDNLPISVNLDSLKGFLTAFNGAQTSPFLYFGKAALLGYTSKGNSRVCNQQYPECPSEPDRLVQYLNNYNGGFFRYFNGIIPQNQNLYQPSFYKDNSIAKRRIQNTPVQYISTNNIAPHRTFIFPREHDYYKPIKYFKFPGETFRTSKTLKASGNKENFEKFPSNHKVSPFIFPDRTGTGKLIFDSNYFKNQVFENNHNDVTNFRFPHSDRGIYKAGKSLQFPET